MEIAFGDKRDTNHSALDGRTIPANNDLAGLRSVMGRTVSLGGAQERNVVRLTPDLHELIDDVGLGAQFLDLQGVFDGFRTANP